MEANSEQLHAVVVNISIKSVGQFGEMKEAFSADERQIRARADSKAVTRESQIRASRGKLQPVLTGALRALPQYC